MILLSEYLKHFNKGIQRKIYYFFFALSPSRKGDSAKPQFSRLMIRVASTKNSNANSILEGNRDQGAFSWT